MNAMGLRAAVLALQGDVREHAAALRAAGAVDVIEVRRPSALEGVDALVVPGGESTTIGRLMRENGLDEAITTRVGEGMAVLGTCAGLILLAAEVEQSGQPPLGLLPIRVRRNAYGRQVDSFETSLQVDALGGTPLPAVFIRAPKVLDVADGVSVLARHAGDPVLLRWGRLLGATFHPEMTADRRIHRYLLDLARGDQP